MLRLPQGCTSRRPKYLTSLTAESKFRVRFFPSGNECWPSVLFENRIAHVTLKARRGPASAFRCTGMRNGGFTLQLIHG